MGLVTKEKVIQLGGTQSSSGNWLRTLPSQQTTADALPHSRALQRPRCLLTWWGQGGRTKWPHRSVGQQIHKGNKGKSRADAI